jgi:hypothetical protein
MFYSVGCGNITMGYYGSGSGMEKGNTEEKGSQPDIYPALPCLGKGK